MSFPQTFKNWSAYRELLIKYHNQKVNDKFGNDPKYSVEKELCLISKVDGAMVAVLRLLIYYLVFSSLELEDSIYAIPITTFQERLSFKPQIVLRFKEPLKEAKKNNRRRIEAEVGFRISKEISAADKRIISNKIQQNFADINFGFKKGRTKISYFDPAKGYNFILAVDDEQDAKKVITATLNLLGDSPNWEFLTDSQSGKNFDKEEIITVAEEEIKLPKRRPIGNVSFWRAEYKVAGKIDEILARA